MITISINEPHEEIVVDTDAGSYRFTGEDLISAMELYINTKKEMEEDNG